METAVVLDAAAVDVDEAADNETALVIVAADVDETADSEAAPTAAQSELLDDQKINKFQMETAVVLDAAWDANLLSIKRAKDKMRKKFQRDQKRNNKAFKARNS